MINFPLLAKDKIFIKCMSEDKNFSEYFKYAKEFRKTHGGLTEFLYIYNSEVPLIKTLGLAGLFEYVKSYKNNNIIEGTRIRDNDPIKIEEFTINLNRGSYLSNYRFKIFNVGDHIIDTNLYSCEQISKRRFKKDLSFYLE